MFRSLHIAATGMQAQESQLDTISNNLANSNTVGFKKVRADFQDLFYQNVRFAGTQTSTTTMSPTGLQIGTGVKPVATSRIFTQGNLQQTGNPLDVAIQGNGFFQVLMPDGTNAYTRAGSFQVDSQGQLVTASGFALQPAITVPANSQSVTIGRDGVVTVLRQGSATPSQVGALQLVGFTNPAGLQSFGENLYLETAASGTPAANTPGTNGLGLLNQGYAETSNVNVVEELVSMIQTQRAYEINSKSIQTSDQMLQRLAQL